MTVAHDISETADIAAAMHEMGAAARAAARELAQATSADKNAAIEGAAAEIRERRDDILAANAEDVTAAEAKGISGALLDRLVLDDGRVEAMAQGLEEVAALADPVGSGANASSG